MVKKNTMRKPPKRTNSPQSADEFIEKGIRNEAPTKKQWKNFALRMPFEYWDAIQDAAKERPGASANQLILEAINKAFIVSK